MHIHEQKLSFKDAASIVVGYPSDYHESLFFFTHSLVLFHDAFFYFHQEFFCEV
jgi:hypothetical protein